jgi:beta-lactam-binding protein with PASTA domain
MAVPEVAGSSVTRARIKLFNAGLEFDRAVPTAGPPGQVVATDPAIGTQVPIGTRVVLFVGAPPDRVGSGG